VDDAPTCRAFAEAIAVSAADDGPLLYVEIASNFWRNLYLFLFKKSTKIQKSALK